MRLTERNDLSDLYHLTNYRCPVRAAYHRTGAVMDIFDHALTQTEIDLAVVQALARICQVTVAYLNAVAYVQSDYAVQWRASMDRQIKVNQRSTKESLWYQIEHSKKS